MAAQNTPEVTPETSLVQVVTEAEEEAWWDAEYASLPPRDAGGWMPPFRVVTEAEEEAWWAEDEAAVLSLSDLSIRSNIRSFIRSFILLFIHSFIRSNI